MLIERCLHVRNYAKHFGDRERDLKGTSQLFWFAQTSCIHGYRTVRAKTENSRQTRINFLPWKPILGTLTSRRKKKYRNIECIS